MCALVGSSCFFLSVDGSGGLFLIVLDYYGLSLVGSRCLYLFFLSIDGSGCVLLVIFDYSWLFLMLIESC